MLHLGVLPLDQAGQFQDTFSNRNRDLFASRKVDDQDMLTFAVPVGRLVNRMEENGLIDSNRIEHRTVDISDLSDEEVEQLFLQQLSKGRLIVAGGSEHAVLVTGFKDKGKKLIVVDPNTDPHPLNYDKCL